MDWSNEDYVRVYTRDTGDLLAIGPEGRAVWNELMRKADKSGIIPHGGDLDVLPELLRVPAEWWEKALPKILKRKQTPFLFFKNNSPTKRSFLENGPR